MEHDYEQMKREAEPYIKFEKDLANRIAYITFDRPAELNSTTMGMRQNFADMIHKCNVDDDVKVVVIRGEGNDFGSGGDLPEQREMLEDPGTSLLHELSINDESVKYPPGDSYRYLYTLTDHYAKARAGNRPLQECKKITIVEAKGYCYGWHFYQAADADLVISSDDALFGHPSFRYYGWGPRMWWWTQMMGIRKFQEMVYTGRPFTAAEMYECNFLNSVVSRAELEDEVSRYALACARNRPTDTVFQQKMFFEVFKQFQGEYLGSLLGSTFESLGGTAARDEDEFDMHAGLDSGLAGAVKDNDSKFPPEWRLSKSGRATAKPKKAKAEKTEPKKTKKKKK